MLCNKQKIIQMRIDGFEISEISQKLNLKYQTVRKVLDNDAHSYCKKIFGFSLEYKNKNGEGLNWLRDRVRLRDNYTCQSCGLIRTPEEVREHNAKFSTLKGKIKSLDVHHLNGLCGKMSKKYEPKSVMNNLITLCHKCHYNHHQFSKNLNKKKN